MADEMIVPTETVTNAYLSSDARNVIAQRGQGKAMQALQMRRGAVLKTAELNRTSLPATIVNFNPIHLRIENGGLPFSVPPCTSKEIKSAKDGSSDKLKIKYKDRIYVGSYITIRTPQAFPKLRDVQKGADWDSPLCDYDVGLCKPIEIAHHFWSVYNVGNNDSCNMGGVLIFEGDRHTLDKAVKAAANGNAEASQLRIPHYELLPTREREYYTKPTPLMEVLEECLERQKLFCDNYLQIAQSMYDNEATRRDIVEPMRIWDRFAVEMKWREKTSAWTLSSGGDVETCKGCGQPRKRVDAIFCFSCNRPYDPYAAFMAGENVPEAYLYGLKGQQLEDVKKEMERRRAIFAPPEKK